MSLENEIKKLKASIDELNQTVAQLAAWPEPKGLSKSETEEPKTIDDVRTALAAYLDKQGQEKTIDFLAKFNAKKVSDIKETEYTKFVNAAQRGA